jgi:muramoyltetrapeptide carboxypeptidase
MIFYPEPLKKGDSIGVMAPSSGVTGIFEKKLNHAIMQIEQLGYKCIESPSVRLNKKLVSTNASQRAKEFMDLYNNEQVKAIIPPWGGQFSIDILPLIPFEELKKPKWILGFSDISTLLFSLTLKKFFATAHGPNLLDFGNQPIDPTVLSALHILSKQPGDEITQKNMEMYQSEWLDMRDDFFPPYNLTEKVIWKSILPLKSMEFSGRIIGGCLDTISKLIGTPYAPANEFCEKFRSEGVIWYFESCDMNASEIYRTLYQMKLAGWFEHCNGILYGRPEGYKDVGDFTLEDAFNKLNEELNKPIIYDLDIGHTPPQMTLINGAFAEVLFTGESGEVKLSFR